MKKRNRRPWLFALCSALILLAGGTAVGLAARLVVSPQSGVTTQVDTPTPPSFIGQSVDEVVFYPWNLYDPDTFTAEFLGDDDRLINWYLRHLVDGAGLLGMSLEKNWDIQDALMGQNVCYWKDRPATTADGQSALLDVAFGKDSRDLGMTWVARSTGELPTRAQKEAALDRVQQDVCALFDPQGQSGDLSVALNNLYSYVDQYATLYQAGDSDGTMQDWYAAVVLDTVYVLIPDIAATSPSQAGQTPQQRLNAISQTAQDMGYHIQLVTTQRQVVVVLTYSFSHEDTWSSVGVYYDMVLEQYSGFAINGRNEYGY